jgi:RecB family exonuclease
MTTATAPTAKLTWSYTSLASFETCPRRYYLTKISKEVAEPPYDHRSHGNLVHKAFENHVNGTVPLAEQYADLRPLADRIKSEPTRKECEMKIALTANLTQTTYFAKDVWFRGVLDVALIYPKSVTVIDYKTGNRKPADDQLELFAGVAMRVFPFAETVTTGYLWLKEHKVDKVKYVRADEPGIWQNFTARVHRIEQAIAANNFPPRKSGLCREWCPVGKSRCEHCGE